MGSLKDTYKAIKRCFLAEYKHHRPKFLRPTTKDVVPTPNYFQTLPPELLLHIFSFLELKPYILSHAVCKRWNALLPSTKIHPVRRRLFNLFKQMLSCPNFFKTRPWLLNNLQPFDRQAYIDGLLSQHPYIPEDFRMWILEWPARMAISCLWPGIPLVRGTHNKDDQPHGVIWLPYKRESPELLALLFRRRTPHARFIPALLLWRDDFRTMWLVFEKDDEQPDLFGSVLILNDQMRGETSAVFPDRWKISEEVQWAYDGLERGLLEDPEDDYQRPYINTLFPNWISYLEYLWATSLCNVVLSSQFELAEYPEADVLVQHPPFMEFDSGVSDELPTIPWTSRHNRAYEKYLWRTN